MGASGSRASSTYVERSKILLIPENHEKQSVGAMNQWRCVGVLAEQRHCSGVFLVKAEKATPSHHCNVRCTSCGLDLRISMYAKYPFCLCFSITILSVLPGLLRATFGGIPLASKMGSAWSGDSYAYPTYLFLATRNDG